MKWRMSGDVESIFEKGEEGMASADGFIRQMVSFHSDRDLSAQTANIWNFHSRVVRHILKVLIDMDDRLCKFHHDFRLGGSAASDSQIFALFQLRSRRQTQDLGSSELDFIFASTDFR
jgi:hypothetical protein